jgi:hypothetical protein
MDKTDLFKISNLFFGGKAIVTSIYSSLDRQRQKETVRETSSIGAGFHKIFEMGNNFFYMCV